MLTLPEGLTPRKKCVDLLFCWDPGDVEFFVHENGENIVLET